MADLITLDWETYYDTDYSLSKLSNEAYVRDPRFEEILVGCKVNAEDSFWVPKPDVPKLITDLKLENKALLCHHAQFDGFILSHHHKVMPKIYLDTMSMARPVTGNTIGVSLAALSKKFLLSEKGHEVHNTKGKRFDDFDGMGLARFGAYCVQDIDLTYALFQVMRQFSTPQEMYIIDMMVRMFTDPVFEFDRDLLLQHRNEVRAAQKALLDKVCGVAGRDALMSNDKFAEILRELGVDPPMKISVAKTNNATKNPTGEPVYTYAFSKQDVAFKQLLEHEDPFVQAVVAARLGVKSTIEETRAESFLGIQARGLLPIYYNYYGAHTGRASGGDSTNLQNMTRGGNLRKSVKAPKGHKVVACDSAQIEARVVAWWAGQQDLVDDFASGADIYSSFASDIFGFPVNRKMKVIVDGKETFPHFDYGFVGKTAILGLGFGMGWNKFLDQLVKAKAIDTSPEFAERVVTLYRTKYAFIKQLWYDVDKALKDVINGYVAYIGKGVELRWDADGIHLPNGMVIRYPELRRGADGAEYRTRKGWTKLYGAKVVENVVQALARIIVFRQMCLVDKELRKIDKPGAYRFKVAGSTHDEVIAIAPEKHAPWLEGLMLKAMKSIPKWASGLPINCEAATGYNYGECK